MIKRLLARLLLLPIALATMAVGLTAPASASSPTSYSTLTDVATGRCLGTGVNSATGQVFTVPSWWPGDCVNVGIGSWGLVPVDHFGDYQISNGLQGWCLDSDYNGSIATRACNGGAFQTWEVTPNDASGSSPSQLKDLATGLCLDSNSQGQAYTLSCNGGNYQRWQQPIAGFNLRSYPRNQPTLPCIGIWAGLAGAWTCTNNADQTWHWGTGNHRGYHQLINGNNDCLGVQNGSKQLGANISAGFCDGSDSQYWARTYGPTSSWSNLLNYNSNLVIGVLGGSTANGAPLVQWTVAGMDQYWSSPTPSFNLENGGAPGRCVGTDAYSGLGGLWNCSTHPDQVWHWGVSNAQGSTQLIDGYGRCLGIQSGSTGTSAQVQAVPCSRGDDQYWSRVADTAPSYSYYLKNYKSGLVLGVADGSTSNGAAVVQWHQVAGAGNQHWSGP